ncbi:flagellar brake protein [Chitinimonas sp.]|uniref:flagellar brake protein n=1 Tax=Chitinimonas sp. TaxID=1934313 RepID=UPI0035B0A3A5
MAEQENPKHEAQTPVPLISEGVDVSNYLLHTPMEIAYVLRSLEQKGDLVSVYYDHGENSFLSAILSVDPKSQRFWFDISGVEAINRSFLRSDHMVFAAAPEGVKIQFVLDSTVSLVEYDDKPAFEAGFPNDVIKLQRREYFRLETPIGRPLQCRLPQPNGSMLVLPLHDISIGGMGLWISGQVEVQQMDVFHGCRIDLGTFGHIEVTLEIRSKRQVTKRDGTVQVMLGTRFVDLPRNTENTLQRYIAQLERERHQLLRN